jgi:hypothetical protein
MRKMTGQAISRKSGSGRIFARGILIFRRLRRQCSGFALQD